jgi:hypothetical protein
MRVFPGRTIVAAVALVLAAFLVLMAGCGGGTQTGPTGSISGSILDGTNTSTGVGGAYVYIPAAPPEAAGARADTALVWTTSDSSGHFTLANVPIGRHTLIARPDGTPGYAQTEIPVDVATSATTLQSLTVVPQSIADAVARVDVVPSAATIVLNQTLPFNYRSYGATGLPLTLNAQPTWSATGGVGTIALTGLFSATTTGSGTVTCALGPRRGSATVTVSGGPGR